MPRILVTGLITYISYTKILALKRTDFIVINYSSRVVFIFLATGSYCNSK